MQQLINELKSKIKVKAFSKETFIASGITASDLRIYSRKIDVILNPNIIIFQTCSEILLKGILQRLILDIVQPQMSEDLKQCHVKFVIGQTDFSFNVGILEIEKIKQTFIS